MMTLRNRAGATLTELIVTLVVLGVFGAGLSRLMTSQSRFINNNEGLSEARRVARGGVNVLLSDLRAVDADSGVVNATSTSLTMRVPWRIGVSCGNGLGAATHVVMPPIDSLLFAFGSGGNSGYAWVDKAGFAHYSSGGNLSAGTYAVCQAESVDTIPGGELIAITPLLIGADAGQPVLLYYDVSYWFGTSWDHSPSLGLFRSIDDLGIVEEVASPFDPTAQFRYYIAGSANPVANPSVGDVVIGIDLSFIGLNRRNTTDGRTQQAPVETAVYFKNR